MITYRAKEADAGVRVDVVVAQLLKPQSRRLAQKLCKDGAVLVSNLATKPSQKLKAGDVVRINQPPTQEVSAVKLPVIYEDKDCVVINKPSGILTHSKGAFNPEPTVATYIAGKLKGMSGERAGIVHRLDRGTSGVIICAKTANALRALQKQFAGRKVRKQYLAIVGGVFEEPSAVIDMPIERNPKKPQKFRVGSNGKPAKTKYKTLRIFEKNNQDYSLVELEPLTGRTHQLRVHCSHLGHPIVGDTFYGKLAADRLMLHAKSLEITIPNGKKSTFTIQPPAEFANFIKRNHA